MQDQGPWQQHWQRKQTYRRRLRRHYILLACATLLLGATIIVLRLDLRGTLQTAWSKPAKLQDVLRKPRPSEAELHSLVGQRLPPPLSWGAWGEVQTLEGGNDQLEILHFPQAGVFLVKQRPGDTVVYASRKKP